MKRRAFLKNTTLTVPLIASCSLMSCAGSNIKSEINDKMKSPKISLAQWSLHRQFNDGSLDPIDFAHLARANFGIDAVEYVNQFYVQSVNDESFWLDMKKRAENDSVKSLLIMVDDEGDLGDSGDAARNTAVENHYKWVNAAKLLGCHSIRVNAFGASDNKVYRAAIIDGMGKLSAYAAKENLNIIIENHGLHSSNARLIVDIIKEVNMPNFGTFPDFGNWCLNEKWGSTQANRCTDSYDIYKGVNEFLPYAKAVSAKSYDFKDNGDETSLDYYKLLKLVKDSGYDGYIGVEYEGERLSESEGIIATKALIKKVWATL